MKNRKIRAWHFVKDDRTLNHQPDMLVEPGYIYSEDSPIVICESGLHGSRRVIDALDHAPGSYLCRVEMWGEVEEHSDKLVARHRHVIAAKDVSSELRLWACWCVRQQWHLLTDQRSRTAIEVAEKFAVGKATQEELNAAWGAAWGAACAAARAAARDAAWAAASAAARAAARDAAWAAASAAARAAASAAAWAAASAAARDAARDATRGAARDAARAAQADELERRMLALFETA